MPIPDFSTLSHRLHQMDKAAFLPRNNPELKHSLTDLNHFLAQQLGKLGFKRPGDLKLFLASPAGESVKTAIAERIAQKSMKKILRQCFYNKNVCGN